MLRPIKKNIIVKLIEKETVSKGGIIMAGPDAQEASKGKVLAIGKEVELVQVGEIILPNWQKAKPTKFEKEDFYIVNEDDVVLIFEEDITGETSV
jgi:co-chaperonin GroES (HSP10)